MTKKYKVGMYGGKFMPLHKGHEYCIKIASKECEKLYLILFYGGNEEENILKTNKEDYLILDSREKQLLKIAKKYNNVIPVLIDVSKLRTPDGLEDWDAETPLVRKYVGKDLNVVYSSETSYDDYFKRAYPEAQHVIIDNKRSHYPISGTDIRKMKKREERELWII